MMVESPIDDNITVTREISISRNVFVGKILMIKDIGIIEMIAIQK